MKDDQSGGLLALVSKVVGVEGGPSFDFSRFISGVFVRHSEEELEDFLCQGDGVPSDRISREWPMPWVFSRVLVFGALAALFAWLCGVFSPGNLRVVPLQMFAYTALIPLGVTVLLFELNVCRSISVYTALKVFLAGGVIAFVASAFVYDVMANTAVSKALGQSEAGIVEEAVKLLAVLLFVRTVRKSSNVLEGIALGAFVGLGFAVFESMGYYFRIFLLTLVKNSAAGAQAALQAAFATAEGNVVLRAWSSPYGHMTFSAIVVGGLILVKGARPFALSMLCDRRFLRIAMIPVLCHMFWDSSFLNSSAGFVVKLSIVAVVEIATLIVLVSYGLKTAGGDDGRRQPDESGNADAGEERKPPASSLKSIPVKWIVIAAAAWLVFDYSQNGAWMWERRTDGGRQTQPQPAPQPQPTSQPQSRPVTQQPQSPGVQRPSPQPTVSNGEQSVVKLKMPNVKLQNGFQNDPYGRFRINRFMTASLMPMPPSGAIMMMPPTVNGVGPNVNVVTDTTTLSLVDYAVQFEMARVNEGAVIRGRNADSASASFALLFELQVKGTTMVSYCRVYADGNNRYAVSGVCAKPDWNAYAAKLQDCVNSFTVNGKGGAR